MASQFVHKTIKMVIDIGKVNIKVTPENRRQVVELVRECSKDQAIHMTELQCGNNKYISFRDNFSPKPSGEAKIIPFPKRKAA